MLRKDILVNSRWLRDHAAGRGALFHPLNHAQGPSQSRHVPNVRISSFIDESIESYEISFDDWKRGERGAKEAA